MPAGRRLALLADFHDGDAESILRVVSEDVPDMIMIPGDVVLGYFPEGNAKVIDRCRNIIPFLRGCAEIAPTFLSVGNHECLLCDEEYDELRATGITLLDNEWSEFKLQNKRNLDVSEADYIADDDADPCSKDSEQECRILIGGLTSAHTMSYRKFREECNRNTSRPSQHSAGSDYIRYPYRRKPRDIGHYPTESAWLDDFTRQEGYKILLCHHPEYWALREPMIRDKKIDLVFAGHAHGGQWRILSHGIFAPYQGFFPKYTSGVHCGPYGRMIISRGMSNPYRALPRWGNPGEIAYIALV